MEGNRMRIVIGGSIYEEEYSGMKNAGQLWEEMRKM
jgi:hypothetical protein